MCKCVNSLIRQSLLAQATHKFTSSQIQAFHQRKVFGLLVPLGFDIAAFTPAAYQGRSLRPPCDEVSSWGRLRT